MTYGDLQDYVIALFGLIGSQKDIEEIKDGLIITRSYEGEEVFSLKLIKSEVKGGTGSKMNEESRFIFTIYKRDNI